MTIAPSILLTRFHDAINALDFETIAAFLTDETTYASGKVGALKGRDDILTAFRLYFAEYPDQNATDSLVEPVSPVAARCVWHLTATSASTGRPFRRSGEEIITFNEDGRIVSVEVTDYPPIAS